MFWSGNGTADEPFSGKPFYLEQVGEGLEMH